MAEQRARVAGLDGDHLLWGIMAIPALAFLWHDVVTPEPAEYVRWTGLISCWLLIATMAVTPLMQVFGAAPVLRWFRKRRRYLGVASFFYAALHLGFWLEHTKWMDVLYSFARMKILPGWIAFLVMIPLAATSFDGAVRRMGPAWKTLQRWVYPAAILTLVHWVMTTGHMYEVWLYAGPLALLSLWRIGRSMRRDGRTREET